MQSYKGANTMGKRVFFGLIVTVLLCSALYTNPRYNSEIKIYRPMSFEDLEELTTKGTDSPTAYVELGKRYVHRQELEKAEAAYLKAIEKDVNFRFAYEVWGVFILCGNVSMKL